MGTPDLKVGERRRESPSGFHFYSTYRNCPRSWYLKYVLGLRPQFTPTPLLFGGAIHEAISVFYQNNLNLPMAVREFREQMQDRRPEYQDLEKFTDDFNRGQPLLEKWASRWEAHDQDVYKVLEVEHEHQVALGPDNEFTFTVRPDRVLKSKKTGVVYVCETKTTSWSLQRMFASTEKSDQVTSYIWAVRKTHPDWNVESCIIDVLYNKGKVFDADRPGLAIRSKGDLAVFELGLYGTITELTQKYLSLSRYPWPLLFPCNRTHCSLFGCEYDSICSTNVQPGELPPGFRKDDWTQELDNQVKVTQNFTLSGLLKGDKL